jgi:hypothetical protein
VPQAVATLAGQHPGLQIGLIDTHPPAHRTKGIVASELPGSHRHVYAAAYGQPPDPPATAALLAALGDAATSVTSSA